LPAMAVQKRPTVPPKPTRGVIPAHL
jgi:hypothetical protein